MRVVLCTAPQGEAQALARSLVEDRLAACVNVVPGVQSIYVWEGAVQDEPECLLVVKTSEERIEDLMKAIAERHSYSVPEVVVFKPHTVSSGYYGWVKEATGVSVEVQSSS